MRIAELLNALAGELRGNKAARRKAWSCRFEPLERREMLSVSPIAAADEYSVDEDGVLAVAAGLGVLDNDVPATLETTPDGQNLVTNGDFELPVVGSPGKTFRVGETWGGWLVGGSGSIDVVRLWENASGKQSVDLNGTPGSGSVSQTLATVPGGSYVLTFAMSGNGYDNNEPSVKALTVWWDGAVVDYLTFETAGHTFEDMGWVYHTIELPAARSSSTTLTLASATKSSVYGPVVDDVSVVAAPGEGGDTPRDPLSALLVEGPSHGTLSLNQDGSFAYTPDADFNGTDTFSYRAADGQAESDPATVTITVNPVNDVRGIVFEDANGNGIRDQGEKGIGGSTVYLDQNGNGRLDQDETSVVTGADGQYAFAGLTPGEYTIRQVPRELHFHTLPADGSGFTISVDSGDLTSGLDFGDWVKSGEDVTSLPAGSSPRVLHGLDLTQGDRWFSYTVERDGQIRLHTNSRTVQVTLYDAQGNLVATEAEGPGTRRLIHAPVTEGEVFYIRISSNSAGDNKVNVTLNTLPAAIAQQSERDPSGKGGGGATEEDLYAQISHLTVDENFAVQQTVPRKTTGNAFFIRDAFYDAIHGGNDRPLPFDQADQDPFAEAPPHGKPVERPVSSAHGIRGSSAP